ncbi:hypothetical protein SLEP1_g48568 [Rubroshorea leprosula]|uniref:Retrovirus-related Pol polyprotein from transposon TNT 1-94-like beta-barrel domain-containing protein n=1 Tax=Rubroshorea leprosula TaxID=152421 RepID=A0AAV5LU39_9ROSI|nr:hypothetical protein SLEP1_g48568 [Rubroshorea leprosula]
MDPNLAQRHQPERFPTHPLNYGFTKINQSDMPFSRRSRVFTLKERLQNTRCEGRIVTEFLHQLKVLADELAAIDKPLTNDDLTVYVFVLNGIGPEFREISASLCARDKPLSFEELHDRLVTHEESMHREETRLENAPMTAHFAAMPIKKPAGNTPNFSTSSGFSNTSLQSNGAGILPLPQRIQPFGSGQHLAGGRGNRCNRPNQFNRRRGGPNWPNTGRSHISCQLCNQFGHTARTCYLFRNQGHGPTAHYAASTNLSTNEWLIDSGANNHITTNLSNLALHSEYNGPDELLIRDGLGLQITHVGHTTLTTPFSSIPLNNVLCVPTASRNLISVSQLCKTTNSIVEFHPNFFLVKDRNTGAILLRGPNRLGMYQVPQMGPTKQIPMAHLGRGHQQ